MRICFNVVLVTMVASSLFLTGCSESVAGSSPHLPTQYTICVDLSCSVGKDQAELWERAAKELVFEQLMAGDSVLVLPVSGTNQTAPIYDASIEAPPGAEGQECDLALRRKLDEVQKNGLAAISGVLRSDVRSTDTLLVKSLARIPTGPKRSKILILTDAVESGPELRLEVVRITDANVKLLAGAALKRARLPENHLRGATVAFVLNALPLDARGRPLNDIDMLRTFWSHVVEDGQGAKITSFDTRITRW